jgi:hypothetical protein
VTAEVDSLVVDALAELGPPGHRLVDAPARVPAAPGLYAIHASDEGLRDLGLEHVERSIPLYVGKAEKSLASRDLRTHFGVGGTSASTTGQSTLRRSFAALLHERLQLTPVPRESSPPHRFAMFALDAASEARLTAWMHENLRLAVWVMPADAGVRLVDVESAVIRAWAPPLNLKGSPAPSVELKQARALMALRARESVQSGKMKS